MLYLQVYLNTTFTFEFEKRFIGSFGTLHDIKLGLLQLLTEDIDVIPILPNESSTFIQSIWRNGDLSSQIIDDSQTDCANSDF